MIVEFAVTLMVLVAIVVVASLVIARQERELRSWYWLAVGEYIFCGVAQMVWARLIAGGGDTLYYARSGTVLARFLEANFSWASWELFLMAIQQQSAFTGVWEGAGANTGSMCAISAFLVFFSGGSEFFPHFLVTGLSLFSALSIFRASKEACPDAPPIRLFVATVLFPSVAFWTSAMHKESFCLMGLGLVMAAWRATRRGSWFKAIVCGCLGFGLVLLFRTAVVPPLVLGLMVYFVMHRVKTSRVKIAAPVYVLVAFVALAGAMLVVSRVAPKLGVDQIGDTFATEQQRWHTQGSAGGSAIDGVVGGEKGMSDKELQAMGPSPLSAQLTGVPIALLNSLFRPQLFDARNFGTVVSAIEMTTITLLVLRVLQKQGFMGAFRRVRSSPFLMMCAVITLVGCTGVGLVTLNFGSLARYRVPFLPFYGALVLVLSAKPSGATTPSVLRSPAVRRALHRRTRPPTTPQPAAGQIP